MTISSPVRPLPAQPLTPEAFQPYGQVILPQPDDCPYGPGDAQLHLDAGIPRFYIMQLHYRGKQFHHITRHQHCTQCLGALVGQSWLLAVAPPSPNSRPDLDNIQGFHIPGHCFVKLEVGTWHAGPFFEAEQVNFYNLELSDTNITDHDTCDLAAMFGVTFELC